MYVTTPDGQPENVEEWTVSASLPSQGIEPISIPVLALTPDHGIGQVMLPAAGVWTFKFTLRTTDIDEDTVTTDFTVVG